MARQLPFIAEPDTGFHAHGSEPPNSKESHCSHPSTTSPSDTDGVIVTAVA
ncbi:MYB DNA-binding domain-containing protein [Histoplasma capsulatum H143]|uniref:MYB DNA-binding domain-containing protein n=1 Tax=Ajellomyces capsulatus (strain H143) TaxID=544712 RepID=C6HDL1_AJECH|nr:MYB DNA-binding domain-containing protein [Histoplasma capsulatum H143]